MKKILATILSAILACSMLTACGNQSDSSSNKDTDSTVQTTSSEKETSNSPAKVIDINLTNEEYAFGVDKSQPELLDQVNGFIKEIQLNGKFSEICNKYFADGKPEAIHSYELDKSKDQLVVATNAEFAPFEYIENDMYYGIDMEIAALLAKKLNKELVIQNMDFDSVLTAVKDKKCDIAMAGLTINNERKKIVDFSNLYYKASQKIIVKSDDTTFDCCISHENVEGLLKGMDSNTKVGIQKGTTAQKYLEGDKENDFEGFGVTCKEYGSASDAVKDMLDGKINFVIVDSAPAESIVKSLEK